MCRWRRSKPRRSRQFGERARNERPVLGLVDGNDGGGGGRACVGVCQPLGAEQGGMGCVVVLGIDTEDACNVLNEDWSGELGLKVNPQLRVGELRYRPCRA